MAFLQPHLDIVVLNLVSCSLSVELDLVFHTQLTSIFLSIANVYRFFSRLEFSNVMNAKTMESEKMNNIELEMKLCAEVSNGLLDFGMVVTTMDYFWLKFFCCENR